VISGEPPAQPPRRRPGEQTDAHTLHAAEFVRGERSTMPATPEETLEAELSRKLERAHRWLDVEPNALTVLKAHVMRIFGTLFVPPTSVAARVLFDPPALRLALELHNLRLDFLDAETDAERVVVLSDAEARFRRHLAYSESDARRLAAEDRALSVSLIGQTLGMHDLPGNTDLLPSFFDDVAAQEEIR
jgi:hypothetical protein